MFFRFFLQTIALLWISSAAWAGETILLTAFEPFLGRSVNNSIPVAQKVAEAKAELGPGVDVEVCILPTVYDKAALAAEDCFKKMKKKPDVVLSLGEGGCQILLETRPQNLDADSTPDNEGTVRSATAIDPSGPPSFGLNLPLYSMYCGLSADERQKLIVSEGLEGFVCNNTAYKLGEYFNHLNRLTPSHYIQYGFMHVRGQTCNNKPIQPTDEDAATLIKMLKALLVANKNAARKFPLPTCMNREALPIYTNDIENIEKVLEKEGAPACDEEFLQRLLQQYNRTF